METYETLIAWEVLKRYEESDYTTHDIEIELKNSKDMLFCNFMFQDTFVTVNEAVISYEDESIVYLSSKNIENFINYYINEHK